MECIDIEEGYISRLRSIDKFVDTVALKYTHQLRKLITNNTQYASNSQKRALSITITSIVNILKSQTYIFRSIQLLLYFLPFRPNIAVRRKANHCFQWLAFFVLDLSDWLLYPKLYIS